MARAGNTFGTTTGVSQTIQYHPSRQCTHRGGFVAFCVDQSQKGWTGPCFTDLDGTGLGYVNLHHYGPCSPEAISSALERITKNNLKPEDPDYTYCDTTYEWEFGFRDPDKPGFVHMPHGPRHFRLLDVLKVKGDKDQMQKIDVHGFGLIDLDRDGRKVCRVAAVHAVMHSCGTLDPIHAPVAGLLRPNRCQLWHWVE